MVSLIMQNIWSNHYFGNGGKHFQLSLTHWKNTRNKQSFWNSMLNISLFLRYSMNLNFCCWNLIHESFVFDFFKKPLTGRLWFWTGSELSSFSPRTHLKLGKINISPKMIKKTIASLDYKKIPGNFVHISKVI